MIQWDIQNIYANNQVMYEAIDEAQLQKRQQ